MSSTARTSAHSVLLAATLCAASAAAEEVVPATPRARVSVRALEHGGVTGHIVLHIVVSEQGDVTSATVVRREPTSISDDLVKRAVDAVRATPFRPTTRDGTAIASRITYVVEIAPASPPPSQPSAEAASDAELPTDGDEAHVVEVRGARPSPRGLGDVRVTRRQLEASPRQHTAELLSAAPGFFVDHEYGEGLGNDVYLRGFDLDHGSGIEMRVAGVPINNPSHVLGQGYADVNFVIPETVRSIRVLQGSYDPRQGDTAIVGSAYLDPGIVERGYRLATSYGSFGHVRVVGIAAPEGMHEDTFVAVMVRRTDGYGARREAESVSVNAQYRADLSSRDTVRVFSALHSAGGALPGIVRQDDVDAGRIGFYDAYPYFAQNQSVAGSRALAGARYEHHDSNGALLTLAPWAMYSGLVARQNFTGALETSQVDPRQSGLGDLFQNGNAERALGMYGAWRTSSLSLGEDTRLVAEPGAYFRFGDTTQEKLLLVPRTLVEWDRRSDASIRTIDVGAYVDASVLWRKRLRIAGGPRIDVLSMSVDDRAARTTGAGPRRDALGFTVGPRITAEYTWVPGLATSLSYGEGFRSLDAAHVADGSSTPYSKVRSAEMGMRAEDARKHFQTTLALFHTWVENELVFEAESGSFETQGPSVRRGIVGSVLAQPAQWLLASSALSVTDARFSTLVPGISRRVPNVPPLLFRTDVTARGRLLPMGSHWLTGRVGIGYTLLSGRPLSPRARSPMTNALNASIGARYGLLELGLDVYNALDLQYPDQANVYVSNWGLVPGQQPASVATHMSAAPPRTLLWTATLYL